MTIKKLNLGMFQKSRTLFNLHSKDIRWNEGVENLFLQLSR